MASRLLNLLSRADDQADSLLVGLVRLLASSLLVNLAACLLVSLVVSLLVNLADNHLLNLVDNLLDSRQESLVASLPVTPVVNLRLDLAFQLDSPRHNLASLQVLNL